MILSIILLRALTGRMSRRRALLLHAEGRLDRLLKNVNPWDGASVQQFVDAAAKISVAAQQQSVTLVSATQRSYFSDQGIDFDFIPEVPDEVRLYSDRASEFVTPKLVRSGKEKVERLNVEEIFNRPIREYRKNVKKGMDESKALAIVANRAKMYIESNVALAEREAETQIYAEAKRKSPKILGYRRVIHPEASESGVCGLCVAASDRMYYVEELKALHNRCKCEVLPVTKDLDPGLTLNEHDLAKLYDTAKGTSAKKLKQVRYKIDDHGELGPVLAPPRGETVQHFTYQDFADANPNSTEPIDLDALVEEYGAV
ncbi:hypothetical protein PXH69_24210 [Rhodococcus qingshengii]|uniref:Phage head morphogenesis domain-containing protein n=1 Tax=Rhodococcus qingshengii TaxID=334542 RepID=A0AAW6LSD7_RHOSG|nr:hypothetical protein [Rhodococcus qingshengii]MDE8648087.1 hypothetical protein [Rhodococcus qingshengii]